MTALAVIKLPFLKNYLDRHGKPRCYFRRGAFKRPLPLPGTPGFMEAYESAKVDSGCHVLSSRPPARIAFLPGSLGWVIEKFLSHAVVQNKRAESTKGTDRRVLDRLREYDNGAVAAAKLKDMRPRHVKQIRERFLEQKLPTTFVDATINLISVLWEFADQWLDLDLDSNPTVGVKRVHVVASEHEPWTPEVFEAFEAEAPGYLRLAMLLLLYSGQRGSDAVQMKWSQYDGECITVPSQEKTGEWVVIPCHKRLKAALDAAPRRVDTILHGARGESIQAETFLRVAFSKVLRRRGITSYSPHGLRKNAAIALAEAGCNVQEIQSILGHRTAAMALKYASRFEKKRTARSAMKKWEAADQRAAEG